MSSSCGRAFIVSKRQAIEKQGVPSSSPMRDSLLIIIKCLAIKKNQI